MVEEEIATCTEVIILIDANDHIKNRNTVTSILMNQLQMVSIHGERHNPIVPATSKGQNKIDFYIATRGIPKYITAAGICLPGIPWEADQHAIFAYLNGKAFFRGKTSKIVENEKRYFTSDNPVKRGKYLENLNTILTKTNIFERIENMRAHEKVTNKEFNEVDNTMTQAMISAEMQLKPKNAGSYEWTPLLSKAGWAVRF